MIHSNNKTWSEEHLEHKNFLILILFCSSFQMKYTITSYLGQFVTFIAYCSNKSFEAVCCFFRTCHSGNMQEQASFALCICRMQFKDILGLQTDLSKFQLYYKFILHQHKERES